MNAEDGMYFSVSVSHHSENLIWGYSLAQSLQSVLVQEVGTTTSAKYRLDFRRFFKFAFNQYWRGRNIRVCHTRCPRSIISAATPR